MKKRLLVQCAFLFLLAFSLTTFSFKDRVHSKTGETDDIMEHNPIDITINPRTDMAVVVIERNDDRRGSESGYAAFIELTTRMMIAKIPAGRKPMAVAIDEGLNIAVITNRGDRTVSVIDLNAFTLTRTITIGGEPERIAINQLTHTALVTDHKDDVLYIIDLLTYEVTGKTSVGKGPKDIAVDSGLNLALIVNEKSENHDSKDKDDNDRKDEHGTVSVIDLNTRTVIKEVHAGKKPQAIDINPETHVAAVVNEKDKSITVINLLTWETYSISVGKHPLAIAINPLDNRALVICDEDRRLYLIDLDTRAIVKSYSLNKETKGIAVNNYTNIAAVIDDKTDSLTLIQLPNPVPEMTSASPDRVLRGSSATDMIIEGNKFIRTTEVFWEDQLLESRFIDNHHLSVVIPQALLHKAGVFKISVVNPAPEGGTNSINFVVTNPIPTITALEPAETVAGTQILTLNIQGTGFFEETEIHFGGIKKSATYVSSSKMQIELASEDLKIPGQYEVMASNLPPGGGDSHKVMFTVKNPLEIKIASPMNGQAINKERIMVKGTFKSVSRDVGITVDGIIAEIRGNEWIANGVPLAAGSNTITATIQDSSGNSATASIIINTTDTSQAVRLSANITSGIAPLQVFFSTSTSAFSPVSYQIDFEGDGVFDYTGTTFENISHTYTSEGFFYPTVTVTDDLGNSYSDTLAITVMNKAEIDTLLKSKWEGIKEALGSKDIKGGLSDFLEYSKERYRQAFNIIVDDLPQIISDMQNIEMIYLRNNVAKYRMNRVHDINGILQTITYYIYFVKDAKGVWKIDRF